MSDQRWISAGELSEAWDTTIRCGGIEAARARPGLYAHLLRILRDNKRETRQADERRRLEREAKWQAIREGRRPGLLTSDPSFPHDVKAAA